MKTMRVWEEDYVEVPATPARNVCAQCAFQLSLARCSDAIHKSPEVFGGDCAERDVVYQPAPKEEA